MIGNLLLKMIWQFSCGGPNIYTLLSSPLTANFKIKWTDGRTRKNRYGLNAFWSNTYHSTQIASSSYLYLYGIPLLNHLQRERMVIIRTLYWDNKWIILIEGYPDNKTSRIRLHWVEICTKVENNLLKYLSKCWLFSLSLYHPTTR